MAGLLVIQQIHHNLLSSHLYDMSDKLYILLTTSVFVLCAGCHQTDLSPPASWSVENIIVYDTVFIFDPSTYEESVIVKQFNLSPRAYIESELNVSPPELVLDGKVHKIKDQYHPRMLHLRWNHKQEKLDTIKMNPID